jgi:AcrR family transcriptional regulator
VNRESCEIDYLAQIGFDCGECGGHAGPLSKRVATKVNRDWTFVQYFGYTGSVALSETQEQILDAAMYCIVRDGVEGASMRRVAREADVSLGLLSYHFDDKRTLIVAAFQLITDRLFAASLETLEGLENPEDRVRAYIRNAFTEEFLTPDYLAMRLALWAISRTDPLIAEAEAKHERRYTNQLASLVRAARPSVSRREADNRATDVIVTQNGLWLNWARYQNKADLERGLTRCEAIALGDP